MACIRTTPLKSNASHRLMEDLGYVNRPGLSDKSVWSDHTTPGLEFHLNPNQVISSARQVVRLSFMLGIAHGEKTERELIKTRANDLARNLIESFITD
jgi:hypothetical protein